MWVENIIKFCAWNLVVYDENNIIAENDKHAGAQRKDVASQLLDCEFGLHEDLMWVMFHLPTPIQYHRHHMIYFCLIAKNTFLWETLLSRVKRCSPYYFLVLIAIGVSPMLLYLRIRNIFFLLALHSSYYVFEFCENLAIFFFINDNPRSLSGLDLLLIRGPKLKNCIISFSCKILNPVVIRIVYALCLNSGLFKNIALSQQYTT